MGGRRSIDKAIRGSTTIGALMRRYPDGRALAVMSRLGWPCGHCSARSTEPLSLAAKRHGNPVRAVIECFRMLESDGPSEAELDAARARPRRSPGPGARMAALGCPHEVTRRTTVSSGSNDCRHFRDNAGVSGNETERRSDGTPECASSG